MLEYEINVDEMPLGKLSKRYIQQGQPFPCLKKRIVNFQKFIVPRRS